MMEWNDIQKIINNPSVSSYNHAMTTDVVTKLFPTVGDYIGTACNNFDQQDSTAIK